MQLVENRVGSSVFQRMVSLEPQVYKKLVIVGDSASGKTNLLHRFTKGQCTSEYRPTVFDTYMSDVDVGLSTVELALWDTPGLEVYDELRPLSYPDKDVVLVCYNIADPDSLDRVETKWMREVKHNCPGVPVLLVGLQKDLRKDKDVLHKLQQKELKPVSTKQGQEMAEKIGAHGFLECSAKAGKGVDEVFHMAARMTLRRKDDS